MDEVDLGEFIFSEDYHKLEGCYLITSRDCYNTSYSEIETCLRYYNIIITLVIIGTGILLNCIFIIYNYIDRKWKIWYLIIALYFKIK